MNCSSHDRILNIVSHLTTLNIAEKGAASLLVRHCKAVGHKMHWIIHQEALCAKSANLVDVMSVVVKVVNSILSRSLNHRQFHALVDEVDVQYGDLL